ncbi:SRPBCC family protein [Neotamlana laminarinivorans]|uniref:Cell division protein n=1 Tax=Neotamlana laminarinivorans TaxID=2883124 RepID=A0A9X1I1A9_9FLAO|nr:cell division protein [Tamlana laminarinivorans]MCB4799973.1 cell division protein [Tamlana laminarinivorans]
MPLIEVETEINADIKKCFDLARDIDFYRESVKNSTEIPINGKISGLVEKGDITTWEISHLFFSQHITLRVSEFNNPFLFTDVLVSGNFKAYKHEHIFKPIKANTLMVDRFFFQSKNGIIGKIYDSCILKYHVKKLIIHRNTLLKTKAESI